LLSSLAALASTTGAYLTAATSGSVQAGQEPMHPRQVPSASARGWMRELGGAAAEVVSTLGSHPPDLSLPLAGLQDDRRPVIDDASLCT
jgi:hypothetical protein